jgi:hypothetical protein
MKERGLTNDTNHAYQMLALLYSTVVYSKRGLRVRSY